MPLLLLPSGSGGQFGWSVSWLMERPTEELVLGISSLGLGGSSGSSESTSTGVSLINFCS